MGNVKVNLQSTKTDRQLSGRPVFAGKLYNISSVGGKYSTHHNAILPHDYFYAKTSVFS